jgi:hypothetical protein
MNWASGFITQIIYATLANSVDDSFALLTENSLNILTETGFDIDIEH